jgi:hypothetical protein
MYNWKCVRELVKKYFFIFGLIGLRVALPLPGNITKSGMGGFWQDKYSASPRDMKILDSLFQLMIYL